MEDYSWLLGLAVVIFIFYLYSVFGLAAMPVLAIGFTLIVGTGMFIYHGIEDIKRWWKRK